MQSRHVHGDGPFTAECVSLLRAALSCHKVMLTTSCTHALEMAGILLDLVPGDEVIVPSFTFVSTATAFVRAGARLVFVDIRPDTLNIDEGLIAAAITPRTRAIVVMHYGGVGCEMETILNLARVHNIAIIEDAAHGIFGKYNGRHLGTLGRLGCLSFHGTKNFTSGEGGALLVNDPVLIDRAEVIREKGTNRHAFLAGQVNKYTWVDVGSSYLPSDVLAAFLLGQLEAWREVQERRRELWGRYATALQPVADICGVTLPSVPEGCEQAYHLFYLLTRSAGERGSLIRFLKSRGIESASHYQPLHSSDAGKRYGRSVDGCPVTSDIADRLLRLPLHLGLTDEAQCWIVKSVAEFYECPCAV